MEIEDRSQKMTDAEFAERVVELLRLVEGLDSVVYHCACRRALKLGITDELRALLPGLRDEALARAGQGQRDYVPNTDRLGLLEVD